MPFHNQTGILWVRERLHTLVDEAEAAGVPPDALCAELLFFALLTVTTFAKSPKLAGQLINHIHTHAMRSAYGAGDAGTA